MTNEQKERINEMRLSGMGYKKIAAELEVSRGSVRNYCERHGLLGQGELVSLNLDVHREKSGRCKQCGEKLVRNKNSGKKLFCSDKCRRAWWKAHPNDRESTRKKQYKCTCNYCKIEFISYGAPDRKYCCHDCYIKDRFWTDPDMEVTKAEIKLRQELKTKIKEIEIKEPILRRIS